MIILRDDISTVGQKIATVEATSCVGFLNFSFLASTLLVLGYIREYIIVYLIGYVGSVNENRLSIII